LFTPLTRRIDLLRLFRFALVGLINTAVGYLVILSGLALGGGDVLSNIAGYAIGLFVSFNLNSRWTFSTSRRSRRAAAWRYLVAFAFAYAANMAVILVAVSNGVTNSPLVHLAGMCLYSALFYIGTVWFVFADKATVVPGTKILSDR
jgi:putative flippase GtrA